MWKKYILPWTCAGCRAAQGWFTGGWMTLVRRERYCTDCCNED